MFRSEEEKKWFKWKFESNKLKWSALYATYMHSPHENINKLYGMKLSSFRDAFNPGIATAYTQPLKYVWIITTSSMQTHPLCMYNKIPNMRLVKWKPI